MTLPEKVNVSEKLAKITKPWSQGIIGRVNDMHIKVAKIEGEFVWHSHEQEDELFYVVEGELIMRFRDKAVAVLPGEFIVIPRGVEHKPEAKAMTSILLVEPAATVNTGDAETEARTHDAEWI